MSLSPQRKAKCLEIIDSLLKYKISYIFAYPIDPKLDHCPDYFTIIKNPMDLLTVQNKLQNNLYSKFSEFCSDIDLIWQNAIEYNGKDSIISSLAQQMKIWFHQKIFLMSDNETADWMTQLFDLQNQVSSISNQKNFNSIQSDFNNESQIKNDNLGEEKEDSNTEQFEMASLQHKTKTFSTENKSKNKIISPSKNQSISKNSKDDKLTKKPKKIKLSHKRDQRTISAAQLIELHRIITHLDDAEKLLKILNIIKKNEPKLNVTENSNIDMNDLSMRTRVKIYDLIQKMNE